ncbi:response regulator [Pseudanabaena biceps]|nr:response regulator [Pseudanabaena biceps]
MASTHSILVIDDEPNNFDVIEALLDNHIYELHYAISGKNVIANLESFRPDLILLDVMMPEMDGIKVCQYIKSSPKWQIVPIIMVTALSTKTDLANCLAAGADDFISKPINGIELRARVSSMLRIKQQYDSIQTLYSLQSNTINILEGTLSELRGNLASRMSHELNTPLNGIIGTIGLLNESLENMDFGEIREMLSWAEESARRLEDLTKKFLIYLELEVSPKHQMSFKSAHSLFTSEVVEEKFHECAVKAMRTADLKLDLERAEVAISDRYLLIILQELMENAIKFSTAGTPITFKSKVVDNTFNFSLQNFGRGMTPEQINRIEALMQFERKNYEQQGIGLGLRIVKKIVELAGGKLTISSVYEKETTVYISLPIFLGSKAIASQV